MPPRPRPELQWDLVAESFAEAVFLWARWDDAMDSPRHRLHDVVFWVEERLLGAIDGVRLGGERAARELLIPALTSRRLRAATVAAHVLASMGTTAIQHVVAAMVDAPPARVLALRRGLESSTGAQWPGTVAEFVPRLPAEAQAAVLEAYAFRRWPSPPGMDAAIDRTAKSVQVAGMRLAAVIRDAWTRPYIEWGLQRSDLRLRIEAVRAALLRGHPEGLVRARDLIDGRAEGSDALLPLLAVIRGERMLPVVRARLGAGVFTRPVFDALAGIGTSEAADDCASLLDDPRACRFAADALRAIAGVDPTPPAGAVVEPEDVPRDELLLPTPAPAIVRERWHELRPRMAPHQRHLDGRPFAASGAHVALDTAPMRRRHLVAAELAMTIPGAVPIATTTWTRVQRAQIAALSATR